MGSRGEKPDTLLPLPNHCPPVSLNKWKLRYFNLCSLICLKLTKTTKTNLCSQSKQCKFCIYPFSLSLSFCPAVSVSVLTSPLTVNAESLPKQKTKVVEVFTTQNGIHTTNRFVNKNQWLMQSPQQQSSVNCFTIVAFTTNAGLNVKLTTTLTSVCSHLAHPSSLAICAFVLEFCSELCAKRVGVKRNKSL